MVLSLWDVIAGRSERQVKWTELYKNGTRAEDLSPGCRAKLEVSGCCMVRFISTTWQISLFFYKMFSSFFFGWVKLKAKSRSTQVRHLEDKQNWSVLLNDERIHMSEVTVPTECAPTVEARTVLLSLSISMPSFLFYIHVLPHFFSHDILPGPLLPFRFLLHYLYLFSILFLFFFFHFFIFLLFLVSFRAFLP